LFPPPSVLENVTLGSASAKGSAAGCSAPRAAIARDRGSLALVERLGLADDALRPVNTLAYGRQRLTEIAYRSGSRPRSCCWTSRRRGAVERKRHDYRGDRGAAARHRLLIIEHDMDLVSAWRGAYRTGAGSVLVEDQPESCGAAPAAIISGATA